MRRRARSNPPSVEEAPSPATPWRHSAMRPTRRLPWESHRQPIRACIPEDGRFNGPTYVLNGLSQRLLPSAFSGSPQPPHRHLVGGRVVCSPSKGFCSRARPLSLRLAALGSHMMGGISSVLFVSTVSRPLARRLT